MERKGTQPLSHQDTSDTALLLSLVVPAEGRAQAIDALIASVQQAWHAHTRKTQEQCAPAAILELLIIDSTVPALDPNNIAVWDASWMYVWRGTQNVRQKRNQGASEARGQWVAFVDSDCLVDPGYLSAVLAAIEDGRARAFAGRVEFKGNENTVWRLVAASQLMSPETQTAGSGEVAWCATANLIIQRSLFMELGGFDETLPFLLGGDDVDLGLRLQRSGSALRILPDALVVHPKAPWSDLRAILARAWRWGRVEYHLAQRHPDKLRLTPPFFTGAAVTLALACGIGVSLTGRPALLWMIPLWMLVSTLLFTLFATRQAAAGFLISYLAGWLDRVYHVGSAYEYLRAGSPRFLWEALILDEHLEALFPAEPIRGWSHLLAVLLVGIVGAAIVAG